MGVVGLAANAGLFASRAIVKSIVGRDNKGRLEPGLELLIDV